MQESSERASETASEGEGESRREEERAWREGEEGARARTRARLRAHARARTMRTMAIGAKGARREGVAGAGIRQVLQTQAHKSSDLMVWRQRSYQRGAAGRVYRVLEMHHAGVTERPLGRCHRSRPARPARPLVKPHRRHHAPCTVRLSVYRVSLFIGLSITACGSKSRAKGHGERTRQCGVRQRPSSPQKCRAALLACFRIDPVSGFPHSVPYPWSSGSVRRTPDAHPADPAYPLPLESGTPWILERTSKSSLRMCRNAPAPPHPRTPLTYAVAIDGASDGTSVQGCGQNC